MHNEMHYDSALIASSVYKLISCKCIIILTIYVYVLYWSFVLILFNYIFLKEYITFFLYLSSLNHV